MEETSSSIGAGFRVVDRCSDRTEAFVTPFLDETGVVMTGTAKGSHAERRRKQRDSGSRRIFADFLAEAWGYRLLTLDERLYRATFPT